MARNNQKLVAKVKELGPWFHQIEVAEGVRTRDIAPAPGPQPVDHPVPRWKKIEGLLPESMSGMRVLDLGSSDGFFSVAMARRGAEVVAIDGAGKAIQRLEWLRRELRLTKQITPISADIASLPHLGHFDFVLMLALLYHLKEPLYGLEVVSGLADELWLETIVDVDDDNAHLRLQAPRPGVHTIPKWIPTTRCLKEMLTWVGFGRIEEIVPPSDGRPIYRAFKE